jgi:hypothetical protein
LIQRIIDQRINAHNQAVVTHTALLMLGISALSTLVAIGSNMLSAKVAESVARDLRDALFVKIQAFSFFQASSSAARPLAYYARRQITLVGIIPPHQ